jgi:hypothetical protein
MPEHKSGEERQAFIEENREWIQNFRNDLFSPAYYTKRWPVEMDGVVDDLEEALTEIEALAAQLAEAERRIKQLETVLEPGKASAIVAAMFDLAQHYGHPAMSSKHALSFFEERLKVLAEAERREKEKDEALERAADTFANLKDGLRLLNHPTMAEACRIAEDGTRAALQDHLQEQG